MLVAAAAHQPATLRFQPQRFANKVSSCSCFPERNRHCTAYPHCKCIKAKGPQSCKLSSFAGGMVHVPYRILSKLAVASVNTKWPSWAPTKYVEVNMWVNATCEQRYDFACDWKCACSRMAMSVQLMSHPYHVV